MNDRIGHAKGIGHFVMGETTDAEHCGNCQWGGIREYEEGATPYCYAFRLAVDGIHRLELCKQSEVGRERTTNA